MDNELYYGHLEETALIDETSTKETLVREANVPS